MIQMERARRLQAYEEAKALFPDVRRIWWFPPLPVGSHVFEIGYGAGHFLKAGAQRGWIMSGIDPLHGDPRAEDFAWPSHAYDAVVAWQVLEHLEDPHAVIRGVRKALKPAGYFVFSVPNKRCLERWLWRDKWDGWRLNEPDPLMCHRSHWDAKTLIPIFQAHGIPIRKVLYQRIAKQLPGGFLMGALLAALKLSSRMTVVARPV